jgi:restriction system protein
MAIPDYETLMLPLMQITSDGKEHSVNELSRHISDQFKLSSEEREQRIPSGQSTYIKNRTGWARTYLKKAGLLSSPKRGFVQITDRGREVLSTKPAQINRSLLEQFTEFREFQKKTSYQITKEVSVRATLNTETPEETIDRSYSELRSQLADELIEQIKGCSSEFFERLVVNVIVAMGYGGSPRDAAKATQRSNDGGIDGIIKQDRLGLDTVYIQAKKLDESRPIHRPEIQKFAGALQGVRARKGIFITTSSFSEGAREYVATIDSKIVLIDGAELAQLMIDHSIGVTTHQTYEIKRLDSDYFEQNYL